MRLLSLCFLAVCSFCVEDSYDTLNRGSAQQEENSGIGGFFSRVKSKFTGTESIDLSRARLETRLKRQKETGRYAYAESYIYFGKPSVQLMRNTDEMELVLTLEGQGSKLDKIPFTVQKDKQVMFEGELVSVDGGGFFSGGHNTYKAVLKGAFLGQGRKNTINQTYSMFRTTESQDTYEVYNILSSQKDPKTLPYEKLVFLDDFKRMSSLGQKEVPKSEHTSSKDYSLATRELFEAGGVQWLDIVVLVKNGGEIRQTFPAAKAADWIYYSGHYPYDAGGFLGGEDISPFKLSVKPWGEDVETMIFASCYAVDINDPNDVIHGNRKGVNGSAWWNMFRGTLLGYGGSAPSSRVDVAIARNFLTKLSKSSVSSEKKDEYSQEMAKLWMKVNTEDYAANAATAVDRKGNYYYLPKKSVSVKGKNYRKPISKWTVQAKEQWEPENKKMMEKSEIMEKAVFVVAKLVAEKGGKPPLIEEVTAHPEYKSGVKAMKMSENDPMLLETLRGTIEYRAHIFYDVPDQTRTLRATQHLGSLQASSNEPVSVEKIKEFFTPPVKRPRQKLPGSDMISSARFEEFASRLMILDKQLTPEEVAVKVSQFFEMGASQKEKIKALWNAVHKS